MCIKWSDRTIRFQLLIIFGSIAAVLLFVAGLSNSIFVKVTGEIAKNDLQDGFLNNAQSDMINILKNGANLLDTKFSQLVSNFPGPMTVKFEDSFRSDYPYGHIPSYYNWPNQLINASYNSAYDANVTYVSSSINLYGQNIQSIDSYPTVLQNIINTTASMDNLFKIAFPLTPEFYAGYIAVPDTWDNGGNTFKRYYPGKVNNQQLSQYINYNGLVRPWYQEEIANTQTNQQAYQMIYTPPYADALNNQIMISIGRICYNQQSGVMIGGFGADMVLSEFQQIINQMNYLDQTRTLFFDVRNGYLLADSTQRITTLTTYSSIQNLRISQDQWNKLVSSPGTFISIGNIDVVSYFLQTSDGISQGNQYMLVSCISHQYILNTYQNIMNNINALIKTLYDLVISLSILLFFATIPIALAITYCIITPFQQLFEVSKGITERLGERILIVPGLQNAPVSNSGIPELDELNRNLREVVRVVGQNSNLDTTEKNPCYGSNQWSVPIDPLPQHMMPSTIAIQIPSSVTNQMPFQPSLQIRIPQGNNAMVVPITGVQAMIIPEQNIRYISPNDPRTNNGQPSAPPEQTNDPI